jgi:hypothetical protein
VGNQANANSTAGNQAATRFGRDFPGGDAECMIDERCFRILKDGGYPREATVLPCNLLSPSRIPMSQPDRIKALVTRAEELDTGVVNCLDPCHPSGSEFWDLGAAAFHQDLHLEECPLEAGTEQDDWLRGWMAAELMDFGAFEEEEPKAIRPQENG